MGLFEHDSPFSRDRLLIAAGRAPALRGKRTADSGRHRRGHPRIRFPRRLRLSLPRPHAPVEPALAEMRTMTAEQLDAEGDQLREAKDYFDAIDCYRAAIRKHPAAAYYNKIAISELLLARPLEAEKSARQAVRKDKHLAEAWNNLAVSYYMQNKLEKAIRTYRHAISLNPVSASFHNNLAAALMDSKQFELGMAEYRKAFELDPSFFEHMSQNGVSAHLGSPQDRAQFSFVMARLFAGKRRS